MKLHQSYVNLLGQLGKAGKATLDQHRRMIATTDKHILTGDPGAWLYPVAYGFVEAHETDGVLCLSELGKDAVKQYADRLEAPA